MNIAEDIKQRMDIVSFISEYVELSKAGRNFRGLCPFHTEKTPSFFVFPDRQSWRCFGCNEGGDLISFVMKKEGLDFGEALKTLAPRAGVVLPEKKSRVAADERTPKLYQINEAAAEYFHKILLTSPVAEMARKYVESRYLKQETVQEFRLGFSLDSWEGLKQHLKEIGYNEPDLVAAGLAVEKEDGRTYDRFRGRLMFPITDPKGWVIGFGARALDGSIPKYLNSAESPIFSKNSVLYGMDKARNSIRESGKVIIVEGYMDALTAHQNGFRNVVASMGTALTENQIAVLKGLTKHICLSLDADAAGSAATLRGIEICRNALAERVQGTGNWLGGSTQLGVQISIISMPEGKDPDEVIREDPAEWQDIVNKARPLMDYLFEVTAIGCDLSRPEGKSQLSEQLLPLIAQMRDGIEREVYLGKLAALTGLSERILAGKLADRTRPSRTGKNWRKAPEVSHSMRTGDQLEEQCLSLLLQYPYLKNMVGTLTLDHFVHSENKEIFLAVYNSKQGDDIQEQLDPLLHDHFRSLVEREHPPADRNKRERELFECMRRLEVRKRQGDLAAERNVEENSLRLKELWRRHSTSAQH